MPWIAPGGWLRSWPRLCAAASSPSAALLFYVLASDALGFIACSVAILCAMFATLGVRRGLIVPIAVVATLSRAHGVLQGIARAAALGRAASRRMD